MITVIILCHPDQMEALSEDLERWRRVNPDYEMVSMGGKTEKQKNGLIILECEHSEEERLMFWLSVKLERDKRVVDWFSYDDSPEDSEEEEADEEDNEDEEYDENEEED